MRSSAAWESGSSRWWFALIVGAVCVWVLSLPIFPSQDGPMHRYYAHALGAVLAHQPHFGLYAIRHPFPPYATQYLSLIGLFHVFSFDMAEKVFTVIEVLCFACGFRLCAVAIGPAGAWVSLLVTPLLLPWYLLMGFFNYSIGLGIALLAVGCWLRMERSLAAVLGFAVCALVLIFSHPVPLLLLLAFQVLDLLRRRYLMGPDKSTWREQSKRLAALAYTVALAIYPSLAIDKSQTANTLSDTGFHLPFVRTALLLTGLSPYNSRSHDFWINGYRLVCYSLLLVTLFWAWQTLRNSLRTQRLDAGGAFLVYAVVFALLLPFLPDRLNGGVFFATRMVILVWVFALLGAAGRPSTGIGFKRACVAFGLFFTFVTLGTAERKLRSCAHNVQAIEALPLPADTSGILLIGPTLSTSVRLNDDLAFDPYLWANILPMVRQRNLVLDAPWLQLSISPLRAAPGAPLIVDAPALTEQAQADPPMPFIKLFPNKGESTVQRSNIVLYAGTERELSAGLVEYLGARDAAEFTCRRVAPWSLACIRKPHA